MDNDWFTKVHEGLFEKKRSNHDEALMYNDTFCPISRHIEVTSRRANFKQCCVVTGTAQFEACHIIPHANGDQTPNFAMNVDDVPLVMQPQWVLDHLQFVPSTSQLGCSATNNDWPPRFLFDVAYGCAALKTWGVKEFVQFTVEKTKEFYYHDGDDDGDGNDSDDGHSVRGAGKRTIVRRNKTAQAKKADRHSQTETLEKARDSGVVDILDVVAGLWAHNARKAYERGENQGEHSKMASICSLISGTAH
ncbi:hypothetical protein F5887DRAFT_1165934 [Amanita rubescens]|nr:hypothetical protein F5887DRAFT_1165934 [Amanita rubescens]